MLQNISNMLPQVVLCLGYVSGIMTCVNGLVAACGGKDTKLGHVTAALGVDVSKLLRLISPESK